MTKFEWLSETICPPARWDLRYLGWTLRGDRDVDDAFEHAANSASRPTHCPVLLDWRPDTRISHWTELGDKRWILAIGVDDSDDRARLLSLGFGEALASAVGPVELAERLLRLGDNAEAMRRYREAGPVELDLFHRDGRIDKQWLGLHPREFALLWRLAENPGERVTRRQLLSDVWRIEHDPETNSVEVHISRLRSKLAISKAGWLVVTDPQGGYRLAQEGGASFFAFRKSGNRALDSRGAIGNDTARLKEGERNGDEAQRAGVDQSR